MPSELEHRISPQVAGIGLAVVQGLRLWLCTGDVNRAALKGTHIYIKDIVLVV